MSIDRYKLGETPTDEVMQLATAAARLESAGRRAGLLVFVQAGRLVAHERRRPRVVLALYGRPLRWTVFHCTGTASRSWEVANTAGDLARGLAAFADLLKLVASRRPPAVVAGHKDTQPREPGCRCQLEAGDSPCPVHGDDDQ